MGDISFRNLDLAYMFVRNLLDLYNKRYPYFIIVFDYFLAHFILAKVLSRN